MDSRQATGSQIAEHDTHIEAHRFSVSSCSLTFCDAVSETLFLSSTFQLEPPGQPRDSLRIKSQKGTRDILAFEVGLLGSALQPVSWYI